MKPSLLNAIHFFMKMIYVYKRFDAVTKNNKKKIIDMLSLSRDSFKVK